MTFSEGHFCLLTYVICSKLKIRIDGENLEAVTLYIFLLPSCQMTAYMKVSMSWPDMAFSLMPGASHHQKDDVGCTSTPF
jgi:hypothetical protein